MTNYMITDEKMWEKINLAVGRASGIYKLRCLGPGSDDLQYIAINRIAGLDQEGVLYIGTAVDLAYRLATVKKSICAAFGHKYKNAFEHSAGTCFSRYPILRERFPLDCLCVTIETVEQSPEEPVDHYVLESKVINSYAAIFGEAPPMNAMSGAINA